MKARRDRPRRARLWTAVAVGVVIGLLLSAGFVLAREWRASMSYGRPSAREVEDALQGMGRRVSFEDVRGTSTAVLGEIRSALENELGPMEWQDDAVQNDVLGCTDAESETPGARSEYARSRGTLLGEVAQDERVVEIVSSVAHRNGYTRIIRKTEVTGTQFLVVMTDRGGSVHLVTGDTLGISVATDCFLPAEHLAELR